MSYITVQVYLFYDVIVFSRTVNYIYCRTHQLQNSSQRNNVILTAKNTVRRTIKKVFILQLYDF